MNDTATNESVQNYYGQVLKSSEDLKTSACCTLDAMPGHLRAFLADIHPEVVARYYGCGSPLPPALEGCTVLDLGCGTGRDCYLLSRLVGESGKVIGVDMTEEQLEVAKRHCDWHAERYGYAQSNVEFVQGYIEDLSSAGIADNSIDVVVSNCVVNLSQNKQKVFDEAYRVMTENGHLVISDILLLEELPSEIKNSFPSHIACVSGAVKKDEYISMMKKSGF
jgi:ubiquinone/menaquinone biosynthesis C-methylase UbiE